MTPETKAKVVEALRRGLECAAMAGSWQDKRDIRAALEALEKEDIDDFLNSAKPLTPEDLEEFGRENRKILDRIKKEALS